MKNIFLVLTFITNSAFAVSSSNIQQDVITVVTKSMRINGQLCSLKGVPSAFSKNQSDFYGSDGLIFTMGCSDYVTRQTDSFEFVVVYKTQQVNGLKLVNYEDCKYSGQILNQNELNLNYGCSSYDPEAPF